MTCCGLQLLKFVLYFSLENWNLVTNLQFCLFHMSKVDVAYLYQLK